MDQAHALAGKGKGVISRGRDGYGYLFRNKFRRCGASRQRFECCRSSRGTIATPALDVLWVPGGDPKALAEIMSDPDSFYLAYLRRVAAAASWICSVCEGALLLARAGLLDGYKATTHRAFVECLQRFPAIDVDTTHQRFVESGNRLTGGGISSGLDEALKLIALLFDQETAAAVQVSTQYFPRPPVAGRIPATPPCTVRW
jgi:transcriptional regulator GlxA family with amidase domain